MQPPGLLGRRLLCASSISATSAVQNRTGVVSARAALSSAWTRAIFSFAASVLANSRMSLRIRGALSDRVRRTASSCRCLVGPQVRIVQVQAGVVRAPLDAVAHQLHHLERDPRQRLARRVPVPLDDDHRGVSIHSNMAYLPFFWASRMSLARRFSSSSDTLVSRWARWAATALRIDPSKKVSTTRRSAGGPTCFLEAVGA